VVTVLLATAALLSAWCAYQATRFSGAQNDANAKAAALRTASAKADSRAGQLELIDTTAFGQYVGAVGTRNTRLAEFYRARFRAEVRPAFEAWLALEPLTNPDAPKTPFTTSAYVLGSQQKADSLEAEAEQVTQDGEDSGSIGDRYVLAVVLLAAALFLLGIQTRIGEYWLRFALVAIGAILVVGTTIWILTLPRLLAF
jgi:hypothetical protein